MDLCATIRIIAKLWFHVMWYFFEDDFSVCKKINSRISDMDQGRDFIRSPKSTMNPIGIVKRSIEDDSANSESTNLVDQNNIVPNSSVDTNSILTKIQPIFLHNRMLTKKLSQFHWKEITVLLMLWRQGLRQGCIARILDMLFRSRLCWQYLKISSLRRRSRSGIKLCLMKSML